MKGVVLKCVCDPFLIFDNVFKLSRAIKLFSDSRTLVKPRFKFKLCHVG